MKEMLADLKVESEADPIIDEENKTHDLFTQQQRWLDTAIHFSDVSFNCRDVGVSKVWIQLLFDEFFN